MIDLLVRSRPAVLTGEILRIILCNKLLGKNYEFNVENIYCLSNLGLTQLTKFSYENKLRGKVYGLNYKNKDKIQIPGHWRRYLDAAG